MAGTGNQLRIFNDAVAIITGGASGIGLAISKVLASRGATVIIADKQSEAARKEVESICSSGGRAEAVSLDVTDYAAVESLVNSTLEKHGRIDYMFNNAGIGVCGLMSDFSLEHWQKVINVNLMGVIHGVHAVYPVMIRQGFGHIVNTSSIGGLVPFQFTGSYTAAKFAVAGLTQSLRVEAMDTGVRVSVICPGVIRTPILKGGGDSIILYDVPPENVDNAWKKTFPADVDRFAAKVVSQVARNVPIIVVPGWWKIVWLTYRLFPAFTLKLMKKAFYDPGYKDLAPFMKH